MSGLRRTALVNLARLRRNALTLIAESDPTTLRADVRANAYGHGRSEIETVMRELGVNTFEPSTEHRCLPAEPLYAGVMRLSAEVVAVKNVEAGCGVSYGYTYRTPTPTRLVLVGMGFADGVPRAASNTASVFVSGARAPIVGRIAMDQFVANVNERTVSVGDEVILFGAGISEESTEGITHEATAEAATRQRVAETTTADWARATGTPALALTAGLGARVERVYSTTEAEP